MKPTAWKAAQLLAILAALIACAVSVRTQHDMLAGIFGTLAVGWIFGGIGRRGTATSPRNTLVIVGTEEETP